LKAHPIITAESNINPVEFHQVMLIYSTSKQYYDPCLFDADTKVITTFAIITLISKKRREITSPCLREKNKMVSNYPVQY